MRRSVRIKGVVLLVLFVLACGVWYAAWREDRRGLLTVSLLHTEEGSAVLIDAPSGRQILIGGSASGGVLRGLGTVMPPWDRSLDVVVAPSTRDADTGGLVDVMQRYRIRMVVQSSVESTAAMWNLFEKEAAAGSANIHTARRGDIFDLGAAGPSQPTHAYLEILFPDRNVLAAGAGEGVVVSRLVYGDTAFLFLGSASAGVQNYLAMLDGHALHADVLFSEASSTPLIMGYVAPQFTVQACKKTAPCGATFVSDGRSIVRR